MKKVSSTIQYGYRKHATHVQVLQFIIKFFIPFTKTQEKKNPFSIHCYKTQSLLRLGIYGQAHFCSLVIFKCMNSTSSGPGVPTSPSLIFMKFYQQLQIHFKLGFEKFQLQIINGWCTSITNVEVTFVAVGFFTINCTV